MRGIGVFASLFSVYDPAALIFTFMYGPSQFGWKFSTAESIVFSKTFLRTRSPAQNVHYFTCLLYELAALCWYDVMRTVGASRSSFSMSKSLAMASVLAFF